MPLRIHYIACPITGDDYFVTAAATEDITVWSLSEHRQVSHFKSVMDFGGQRLAIQPGDDARVFAGAYHRHGLCAYTIQGELIWQRRDLKKVQRIAIGRYTGPHLQLSVQCASGPYHLLELATGEAEFDLPGVRYAYAGPTHFLAESTRGIELYRQGAEEVVWARQQNLRGDFYGIHDAVVTDSRFVYSEAMLGHDVRCYSLDGTELWNWSPPSNHLVEQIRWDADCRVWRLIEREAEIRFPKTMVTLDPQGAQLARSCLEDVENMEFLDGGRYLVTSKGQVVACESGEVVWQFVDGEL
ncbi:MAG: hypothetical protein WDZ48_09905 [Pirellulales bacterium]